MSIFSHPKFIVWRDGAWCVITTKTAKESLVLELHKSPGHSDIQNELCQLEKFLSQQSALPNAILLPNHWLEMSSHVVGRRLPKKLLGVAAQAYAGVTSSLEESERNLSFWQDRARESYKLHVYVLANTYYQALSKLGFKYILSEELISLRGADWLLINNEPYCFHPYSDDYMLEKQRRFELSCWVAGTFLTTVLTLGTASYLLAEMPTLKEPFQWPWPEAKFSYLNTTLEYVQALPRTVRLEHIELQPYQVDLTLTGPDRDLQLWYENWSASLPAVKVVLNGEVWP